MIIIYTCGFDGMDVGVGLEVTLERVPATVEGSQLSLGCIRKKRAML